MRRRVLNVSDPDVFSGVDIVHGIERDWVFSAIRPLYGGWNGNAVRQFTV
jgi:hypothetical protein